MGHNWKAIVNSLFPGRTALQARNQYNLICRRTGIDTQQSTPGSTQGLATPLPMERSLLHIQPSNTEPTRPLLRRLPTDADFECEESNTRSGEDDNNNENTDPPQSEEWSRWDPASEFCHIQAHQSPSKYNAMSPHDLETLTGPSPDDGMRLLSSFDLMCPIHFGLELGDPQAFQQASNQSFTGHQVWKARRTRECFVTDIRRCSVTT